MSNSFKIFNEQQIPQKTLNKKDYDSSKDVREGFTPGEIINSKVFNTVLNAMTKVTKALLDSITTDVKNIDESSNESDIEAYIKDGLKKYILNVSPTPTLSNLDEGNNATISFSVGKSTNKLTKTINNVANAGSASTAIKLQTARTINVSGDAIGTAQSFDGSANVTIPVNISKSESLKSINVGDTSHPVYFNAEGKPVRIEKVANSVNSDKTVWSGIEGIPYNIANLANTIKTTKVNNAVNSDKLNVSNIGSTTFTWNESTKTLTIG